jgi:hypothetical protein
MTKHRYLPIILKHCPQEAVWNSVSQGFLTYVRNDMRAKLGLIPKCSSNGRLSRAPSP